MEEWNDFMVFELDEEGNKTDLKLDRPSLGDYLTPDKVFLILFQEIKRIYLWKGARSSVRKRFLGSRVATVLQGDVMKAGLKRCKVVAVDQGEELEEFLNVFGLESMEIKEEDKLEDKKYIRNIEKEEMKIDEIKNTKLDITETSKLSEIKQILDQDEKILWIKNSSIKLTENWFKVVSKDKKYKARLKHESQVNDIAIKEHEVRYVITNKRIILNHIFNRLLDYSDIPKYALEEKGDIILLDQRELRAFDIEESGNYYYVNFHVNPEKKGDNVVLFENLTLNEYENLIRVLSLEFRFIAQIPEKLKTISYSKIKNN
ncbi:MAG: hypothetical protein JW891_10360 [Candidatus Lokiarchaeota archaeon]|nr:hypothetical protein [Candidatus Lokiarchaeota archaeon]